MNKPQFFIKSSKIEDIEKTSKGVRVKMRVSSEERDREGDLFLKSAWEQDKDYFLNKGYIDYNHLSRVITFEKGKSDPTQLADTELQKLEAVIGYPNDLYWDDKAKGLYCHATLSEDNKYVKSMIGLMRSGYDRFEASVAGAAFSPTGETVKKHGSKTWDRARIQHIAICPTGEAINPDTKVELMKSTLKEMLGLDPLGMENALPGQLDANNPEYNPELYNSDPIREFIIESEQYKTWVGQRLIHAISSGHMPIDYETVVMFLEKYLIPESEIKRSAKMILTKYDKDEYDE